MSSYFLPQEPGVNAKSEVTGTPIGSKFGVDVNAQTIPTSEPDVSPTNYSSSALEASAVVKASAGNLWGFYAFNQGAVDQFIMIFDSATVPANGVFTALTFSLPAGKGFSFDATKFGRKFANGIAVCNSTTSNTKTLGAADCKFDVQYS